MLRRQTLNRLLTNAEHPELGGVSVRHTGRMACAECANRGNRERDSKHRQGSIDKFWQPSELDLMTGTTHMGRN